VRPSEDLEKEGIPMGRIPRLALVAIVFSLAAAAAAQDRPERPPDARPAHPLIAALDTDGDGALSEAEIADAPAKLRALDTSGDGKITGDELPSPAPAGRPGGRQEGGRGFGGPGGGGRGRGAAPTGGIDNPLLPKDEVEKTVLAALDASREGPRFANVSTEDGRLLRLLTESLGAQRVVEIGTSTGESAIWFALALRRTGGKLYTHEIDPERIQVAKANFDRAGVSDLITVIEGDAHETVRQHKEPIDILFLDADKEGYIDYLRKLLPIVRPGGLVLAHNMRGPAPDPRYVEAITRDPALETAFLLMDGAGIGVTMKKR